MRTSDLAPLHSRDASWKQTGFPVIAVIAGIVAAIVVLGASILWVYYGSAVFFKILAAGIAACL